MDVPSQQRTQCSKDRDSVQELWSVERFAVFLVLTM
jgi:hypothetical protein